MNLVLEHPQGNQTFELDDEPLRFGAPEDPLPIPGKFVTQGSVHLKQGRALLTPNVPLWIGHAYAAEGVERLLLPGDVVDFGNGVRLRIPPPPGAKTTPAETRHVLQCILKHGPVRNLNHQTLVCLTGLDQGRRFALREGRAVVGRGLEAELRIRDRTVSRKHLQFDCQAGTVHVKDVGTCNGTRLNGRPLNGCVSLVAGDVLEMGKTVLRLYEEMLQTDDEGLAPLPSPDERPAPSAPPVPETQTEKAVSQPGSRPPHLWGWAAGFGMAFISVGLWFGLSAVLGLP